MMLNCQTSRLKPVLNTSNAQRSKPRLVFSPTNAEAHPTKILSKLNINRNTFFRHSTNIESSSNTTQKLGVNFVEHSLNLDMQARGQIQGSSREQEAKDTTMIINIQN